MLFLGDLDRGSLWASHYLAPPFLSLDSAAHVLKDERTRLRIDVVDLLGETYSCQLRTIQESQTYLVLSECLIVFVVDKENKKIEAVTTLPDFEERGKAIMDAVGRGLPSVPVGKAHVGVACEGGGTVTSFDEVAARHVVSRLRGLCEERKFRKMQSLMDPLRVLVDRREGLVIDLRTGYRISFERIKALQGKCPQQKALHEGGLQIVTFCEHTGYRLSRVVFAISPDRKIRAMMDEAAWKSRGEEILSEIRGELTNVVAGADDVGQRASRREDPTPVPEPR